MAQTQPQKEKPIVAEDSTQAETEKREQSLISFPYLDLNEGIKVAKAVFEVQGSACQLDQAAAQMKESPTSSNFRSKVSAAKIFGLLTTGQGSLTLTKLGAQICDPQQEKAARAEAFLAVPLYKAIFEKFRGTALPPNAGLESAMTSLGVADKQKERARQIFQRSAQEAGFFQFGTDRLVMPAIKATSVLTSPTHDDEIREEGKEPEKAQHTKDSGGGGGEQFHPFIQGLLIKLPPPDSEWPNEARAKWLQAAINIFELMYKDSEDSRSIVIDLKKDSAK
jgi:hypothetical protein